MKLKLLALVLMTLTATAVAVVPMVQRSAVVPSPISPPSVPEERPQIEVVFVLDTTGSMGGLIDAAKEKIWSIATTMASANNAPHIKIGLVAYRDRGDDYVTQVTPLSEDLDQVYARLMDYQAGGGGDAPESVIAGLTRAVNDAGWSQRDGVYRVVFLVGDAPPQNYGDEPSIDEVARLAASRGLIVNTIRCGTSTATQAVWQQIAGVTQGEYFSVGQQGDALAIATPFDAGLAELSAQIDATRMFYGDEEALESAAAKSAATSKLHRSASVSSRARRATFNASGAGKDNAFGKDDLIAAIERDDIDLADVDEHLLPEPLQAMAPSERKAHVQAQREEREALMREVKELAEKREAYLASKVVELESAPDSLDYKLGGTLLKQAKEKGIVYADEATPKL